MNNIEIILKETIENEDLFNSNLLKSYILHEKQKRKLKKQIQDIEIDSNIDSKYDANNRYININPIEMLMVKRIPKHYMINLLSKTEIKKQYINDINYLNVHTLYIINHELEHASQVKLMSDEENFNKFTNFQKIKLLHLIKSSLLQYNSNMFFNGNIYTKYHDYFMDEYDANINSFINTICLLNFLDIDKIKEIIVKFNMLAAKNILYSYKNIANNKISTPSNNFIKIYNDIFNILNKKNEFFIDIIDLNIDINTNNIHIDNEIDRLKLGLSLKKDTINYLKAISNKKHKTLNLFNDIENF